MITLLSLVSFFAFEFPLMQAFLQFCSLFSFRDCFAISSGNSFYVDVKSLMDGSGVGPGNTDNSASVMPRPTKRSKMYVFPVLFPLSFMKFNHTHNFMRTDLEFYCTIMLCFLAFSVFSCNVCCFSLSCLISGFTLLSSSNFLTKELENFVDCMWRIILKSCECPF